MVHYNVWNKYVYNIFIVCYIILYVTKQYNYVRYDRI
jgi:hypothetical protein